MVCLLTHVFYYDFLRQIGSVYGFSHLFCVCMCVHTLGSSHNQPYSILVLKNTLCVLCAGTNQLDQDQWQDLDRVSSSTGPCPQK